MFAVVKLFFTSLIFCNFRVYNKHTSLTIDCVASGSSFDIVSTRRSRCYANILSNLIWNIRIIEDQVLGTKTSERKLLLVTHFQTIIKNQIN